MTLKPVIVWFRDDLRLNDHRALAAAVETGAPIIPVYVFDDVTANPWAMGAASRWWLARSLAALSHDIETRGGRLILRRGAIADVLPALVEQTGATAVYFSRGYEPQSVASENALKSVFEKTGVGFKRYAGRLLREPEDIRTKTGDVYKVYTPFWRALSANYTPPPPITAPSQLKAPAKHLKSDKLADWLLIPTKPDWSKGFSPLWQPGEAGARIALDTFLKAALKRYTDDRNRPDVRGTSRLSPHLHFGEITPAACWRAAVDIAARTPGSDQGLETFLKELVWREFSYTLLFHWPDLPETPFKKDFAAFPWSGDGKLLKTWQRGQTGYPIVDAGMRELWATGYMHNRVRMIVASFLIKHLLISWQQGEAWFWDTLLDADLASNAASWQWVAGSGADAAPYFRIFNPVTQGGKFDPEGVYVRTWVPELKGLPNALIHAPWTAPPLILSGAGVTLGKTYPKPIVDHAAARVRALAAYDVVKAAAKSTV
ncbi:MAG: DNA photolyase family protein [Hyphomicrobium sp.]|nr:DNA photolyase family protein [Hyphomicrobium sp.]